MGRKVEKKAMNNLRAWREFRGKTQEELAKAIGTKGNVIGMLESGERQLSPKWLNRLAPALGTTPGFLLDHNPYEIDTAFLEEALQTPPDKRREALGILRILRTGSDG